MANTAGNRFRKIEVRPRIDIVHVFPDVLRWIHCGKGPECRANEEEERVIILVSFKSWRDNTCRPSIIHSAVLNLFPSCSHHYPSIQPKKHNFSITCQRIVCVVDSFSVLQCFDRQNRIVLLLFSCVHILDTRRCMNLWRIGKQWDQVFFSHRRRGVRQWFWNLDLLRTRTLNNPPLPHAVCAMEECKTVRGRMQDSVLCVCVCHSLFLRHIVRRLCYSN